MKKLMIAAAMLIVLANIFVLSKVYINRLNEPVQSITLSAAELAFTSSVREENSAVYLELEWLVGSDFSEKSDEDFLISKYRYHSVHLPLKKWKSIFNQKEMCDYDDRTSSRHNFIEQVEFVFVLDSVLRKQLVHKERQWINEQLKNSELEQFKRSALQDDLKELDKVGTALFLSDVVKLGEETSLNTHLPTVRLKGTLENYGCDGEVGVNLENNERLLVENRFHEIIKQNPENYSVQLNIGKLGIPWVDNVRIFGVRVK